MTTCEAIVIGGSAGSLDVLIHVLPLIDPAIHFSIIIVLHRKPGTDSILTDLLSTKTKLTVKEIEEKDTILPGVIYLAPSDYHLLIEKNNTFSLDSSEKINYSRPSIDVTFQSAADVYKDKLVCFLLSGSNADGVEGLKKVKECGGRVIIQNPQSAAVSYMPAQAALHVKVDETLQIENIAEYINHL
jgi:two-component system chemotaxis response regulator CheB